MSSLRRGHANLLCIVPILSYETAVTPLDSIQDAELQKHTGYHASVAGVMVSIVAFQAVDPGSIPGPRTIFFS